MHKKILDSKTVNDIRSALLISNAMGAMEAIRGAEPAAHTKRARTLKKAYDALDEVLDMYGPAALQYNLCSLATELFEGLDERLNQMVMQGLAVHDDVASICERWKEGDILTLGDMQVTIYAVRPDGYDYVDGSTILYSEANFPTDPFMIKWGRANADL